MRVGNRKSLNRLASHDIGIVNELFQRSPESSLGLHGPG
jgi:hypothetical protein